MKKTVSISVDSEIWEKVKETAWGRRQSVSSYVEMVLGGFLEAKGNGQKSQTRGYMDAIKSEPKKGTREWVKLKFPNQMCPQCHLKNRDCECA